MPDAANSYEVVISGGRVIDPASGRDETTAVAISEGRIAAIGPDLAARATRAIDARGVNACGSCRSRV